MDSSQLVTTLHQNSSLHGGQSTSTRGWSVWVHRILLENPVTECRSSRGISERTNVVGMISVTFTSTSS